MLYVRAIFSYFSLINRVSLLSRSTCSSLEFKPVCECTVKKAQSVERATLGEEVPDSIPAVAARSLLVGSVSV